MDRSGRKEIDSVKAKQIWMRYRKRHDLSERAGRRWESIRTRDDSGSVNRFGTSSCKETRRD